MDMVEILCSWKKVPKNVSKNKLVRKNAVRLSMGVARSGLWAPGPNNDGRMFNITRLKK